MYEIGVWGKNKRKAHLVKVSKFLIVLQELSFLGLLLKHPARSS